MDAFNGEPIIDLRRYDDREHLLLASFATHSRDSKGRIHPEKDHSYRGPYARDRDRILSDLIELLANRHEEGAAQ